MHLGERFISLNRRLKIGDRVNQKIALHSISQTEVIGTIIHSGFKILKEEFKHPHLYLDLKKIAPPGSLEEVNRSRQWLFKQPRIGKGGKIIHVLKVRTMYPMAHRAHEYLLQSATLGPYGKPTNDFRITKLGKVLRTYWLDELPQLINILKGEMKLVGVRPLSEAFFKTLPLQLQVERLKHLPALMAAIYAHRPQNLEDRFKAEFKYLSQHQKQPFLTDIKYFFKIIWSIIFRGQRGY